MGDQPTQGRYLHTEQCISRLDGSVHAPDRSATVMCLYAPTDVYVQSVCSEL
jgi:hypothetical protein